ncbi:MAG: hypothetical protein PHE89_07190 [Alphaproteobacteria bacterium]|nr:hypothetical protein [Alphaproteobacteria bacterium]
MKQIKNRNICLFLMMLALFFTNIDKAQAAVHFITKKTDLQGSDMPKPCQLMGYLHTEKTCTLGRELTGQCPSDGTYWKFCACAAKFQYGLHNCPADKLRGEICNNILYTECGCDEDKFPYTKENCPAPKVLSGDTNCDNTNFPECNCPEDYDFCPTGMVGMGESCDGKYEKCACDPAIFQKCSTNKGAAGSQKCTDTNGDWFTSCEEANCPTGTVNLNTYWTNGDLKYFLDVNKRKHSIVGSKTCVIIPPCAELGFNMNCDGLKSIKCPFDTTKEYCIKAPVKSCYEQGYASLPSPEKMCDKIKNPTNPDEYCYANCTCGSEFRYDDQNCFGDLMGAGCAEDNMNPKFTSCMIGGNPPTSCPSGYWRFNPGSYETDSNFLNCPFMYAGDFPSPMRCIVRYTEQADYGRHCVRCANSYEGYGRTEGFTCPSAG